MNDIATGAASASTQHTSNLELTDRVPDEPYGKHVGNFHRGFEVLELFSVEQRPLTVNEIATNLHYPQSSTSVLLHALTGLGFLQYDRRARTFLPTLRVGFLGMWIHERLITQGSLLEFMEMLANRSGHVAMLGMQNGLYAQYIHIVSARFSRVGLKPGLLRPICRSAAGKALLSTKSESDVRLIVRNVNAIETDYETPVNADELILELEACRRTGFAYSKDSVNRGASVIAALIPTDINGQPIVVSVGLHSWEFDSKRDFIVGLIREALDIYFPQSCTETQRERPHERHAQAHYAVEKKS